ncbi:hypothetical protein ACI2KV_24980 [Micromonospora chokoriensis]
MQTGLMDVYANHGVLIIGDGLELDADVPLRGVAAASSSHILLGTRGQAGLVRVRIWDAVGPLVGESVIAARLKLHNPHLCVFDIEKISAHSFYLGRTGEIPIRVMVDDPGFASRVDVLVGVGSEERELTCVAGYPLFPVAVSSGVELEVADELDLILSGHDLPLSRLAAAIKLILSAPVVRPAIQESRTAQLAEWSRWLTPQQSIGRSRELGRFLHDEIMSLRESVEDVEVLRLAEKALRDFVSTR